MAEMKESIACPRGLTRRSENEHKCDNWTYGSCLGENN